MNAGVTGFDVHAALLDRFAQQNLVQALQLVIVRGSELLSNCDMIDLLRV
jgi:hypothetical protein